MVMAFKKPAKPFKNPIAPKEKTNGEDPWSFKAPNYDQRSGPSVAAGDYYGIGFKAPVGRMRGDSVGYDPVPKKNLATPPESVV
jgi:hypothetical protein